MQNQAWTSMHFEGSGQRLFAETLDVLMNMGWDLRADLEFHPWALGVCTYAFDPEDKYVWLESVWSQEFDLAAYLAANRESDAMAIMLFKGEYNIILQWCSNEPKTVEIWWNSCDPMWRGRKFVPDLSFVSQELELICKRHPTTLVGATWEHCYC